MTTYDGLRSITSNDKLIAVLTGQWGDYGMPPKESSFVMHCMIANHYFDGASYPVGGSSMIANTIGSFIKKIMANCSLINQLIEYGLKIKKQKV